MRIDSEIILPDGFFSPHVTIFDSWFNSEFWGGILGGDSGEFRGHTLLNYPLSLKK